MSPRIHEQQYAVGNQEGLIWARKGSLLLVNSGSMRVARATDAGRLFTDGILLHEGECHTAERSGWLCVRSEKGAGSGNVTFLHIEALPRGNFLRRLIGRFRTKLAAARPSPVAN
jgi:hypothetical protein